MRCCIGLLSAFVIAGATAGPQGEPDLTRWKLQLNRGARATAKLDTSKTGRSRRAVQIDIQRLCSPGQQKPSTNVHLRHEWVTLKPGKRYVYRVWARAAKPRPFGLRLNL